MGRESQADFVELAVGMAEAGDEAEAAAVEHACAEDVQLTQRWQLRQAGQEQPAAAKSFLIRNS